MKLIKIKGDNGRGCYAGVSITIVGLFTIPLFWLDFFAQEDARDHDTACDGLSWEESPDAAYFEYSVITRDFLLRCLALAGNDTKHIFDSYIAYWFAMRFGDFKYELMRK